MTPSLVPKPCGQKPLSAGELRRACLFCPYPGLPALSLPSSVKRRQEEPQEELVSALPPSDGGFCWRVLLGEVACVCLQGRILRAGEAMGEFCLSSALHAGWSLARHSTSPSLGVLNRPLVRSRPSPKVDRRQQVGKARRARPVSVLSMAMIIVAGP